MERIDRDGLSDLPTEDIDPVRLREQDYSRIKLEHLYRKLSPWINTALERTAKTGKEQAFKIDRSMNVVGMIEGDETSVSWPRDYAEDQLHTFHTHPPRINKLDVDNGEGTTSELHTPSLIPSNNDIQSMVGRYEDLEKHLNLNTDTLLNARNKPTGHVISLARNSEFSRNPYICIVRYKVSDSKQYFDKLKMAHDRLWSKAYGLEDTQGLPFAMDDKNTSFNRERPSSNFKPSVRIQLSQDAMIAIIESYAGMADASSRRSGIEDNDKHIAYDYFITKPSEPIDL